MGFRVSGGREFIQGLYRDTSGAQTPGFCGLCRWKNACAA